MTPHDKTLKALRTFFRISNIAFETVNAIVVAVGGVEKISPMHNLHRIALKEIEREQPNMEFIYHLMDLMEVEAKKNKKDQ